ncbi:uncharacterized protein LOC134800475 [Cydia splendana]|uniref:uncharacterized protein LOC134800475 n=1 Tax=Cydia splendana TaxID=1100963 RepID=UPI0028F47D6D
MLESFVNMLYCILTLIFVLENVFSTHSQSSVNWLNLESCDYGDTVENLCNKCVCTAKGVYHCKAKGCDRVPVIYLKKPTACQPNVVYNQLFTSCICSAEGQWPHKVCYDVFGHLPMESIKKKTCEPQGYVQVECNICRCNDNGEVDSTRCTINECDVKMPHFRKNTEGEAKKNLFGQCIVKNWYSLAPCQFCYCVDTNKLMCSTSVTQSNRQGQMNLGPTTLVHCGPGLLKEIAALVPNQKKFRSLLSSNEDGVWSNGVDVKTSQNSQITEATTQYDLKVEKINKGPDDQLALLAQMAYYEVADADGKENKMNADDMTIDFRARFDANSPRIRKQNGGLPMTFNYDPLDAVRRSLKLVKAGECEPGTAINVKCNLCHCLKNGKMLCTDKKCH